MVLIKAQPGMQKGDEYLKMGMKEKSSGRKKKRRFLKRSDLGRQSGGIL